MPEQEGRSRREDLYEAIRAMLISGEYHHGDVLVESRIGERLGVSRTPVRESLVRLESDGLIELRPNGTKVVVDLWRKVGEVLEIRVRLEPLAVRLAANRMTGEELEELGRAQDRMEEDLRAGPDRIEDLLRRNAEFHWDIVRRCGNESLVAVLDRLRPFSVFPRILTHYTPETLETAIGEHREILDALWKRDGDRCEELVTAHIRRGAAAVTVAVSPPRPGG